MLHHYHLPRREKLLLIDDKSDNHLSQISVKHWRKKVQVQAPSVLFYLWMWQECPNGSSFTRKIVKFPPKITVLNKTLFCRFGDLTYDAGDITFNFAPLVGLIILLYILRLGNDILFKYQINVHVHSVWKSQKKSHSTLRAKRATFTFWVVKS